MAEILGLVASVVAVIEITEAVERTISVYLNTLKSVRAELIPLLSRLRHLNSIMSTLQLEMKTIESPVLQVLRDPLMICKEILTKIQWKLDHLKVIAGYVVGPVLDKESSKCLKQLDDLIPVLQLALDAEQIAGTHAIEEYLQSLRLESLEQAQMLRDDVRAHHQDAQRWKEEADHRRQTTENSKMKADILSWLTSINPESNYMAARQRVQPGTGQWLLETKQFLEWEVGNTKGFWLNAMAGAGKTMLTSTVIDYLIAKHDNECIIYYFFDFKETQKQDVQGLVASLLAQLVATFDTLPELLVDLFERHRLRNPTRPSLATIDDLLTILVHLLNKRTRTFVVIDALDESSERELLLQSIYTIFTKSGTNCKVFLSSRAEKEIQGAMEGFDVRHLAMERNAIDHDVGIYVRAIIETNDRLRAHRQGIKDLITTSLIGGANGMFRWVQCQVDHIKTLRTANEIKLALRKLPPNLDSTYDRILTSVQAEDQHLLRKALSLVVFSARPLRLKEVAEAVIIEPGISEIDEDDRLQKPEDLLDIGKDLFAQENKVSALLELSHYSVKEYLLSERIKKGPAAAFAIDKEKAKLGNAVCLLTYLGLETFEDKWNRYTREMWEPGSHQSLQEEAELLALEHLQRLEDYPLLEYAATNSLRYHCQLGSVQHAVSSLICDLFSSRYNGRFLNMTYTCVYNPMDLLASYERLFRYSLIGTAARYNLKSVVQDLLAAGTPVDQLPSRPEKIKPFPEGQTALYRAADFGHEDICKILVNSGANVQGTSSHDCPLSAACRSGKPTIVRLILNRGVDVTKDGTPLSETQLAIWWRLVEDKADSNWQEILDLLRDTGAKWSAIGLLSAFSKSIKKTVKHTVDELQDESIRDSWTPSDKFEHVINEMDTNILNALQWLVQDEAGCRGFKTNLKNNYECHSR